MRDDLKTLERGLRVLSELARHSEQLGPRELERRLGIARSAVQRGLATLKAHGFVRQDPTSKLYELGYAALALGEGAAAKKQLVQSCKDRMQKLCALANETVCLNVRDGTSRVPLFQVETEQELRVSIKIGQRYPLLAGAGGRALLAFLPSEELAQLRAQLVSNRKPSGAGPKSWREIERSLVDVRSRGYAVTQSEAIPEAVGIAAPIFDSAGRTIASIGIYGPAFRLTRVRVIDLGPRVKDAAKAISRSLGATKGPPPESYEVRASNREKRYA
jgi:IclR family transcriptional regulator, acetate operon repressor